MTIGNDILPGIITDVNSLQAISVGGLSDANVVLVGSGNLSEGEAEANQPYTITRNSQISENFGTGNKIAEAIDDALTEGAMPVYAVVTDENENTETISSQSGTFTDVPLSENPDDYTIDGYEVEIVHGTPVTPDTGVVEINPTSGDYEFDATPTDQDVTYKSYDYSAALQAVEDEAPDEIDYVYVLSENADVAQNLNDTLDQMESYGNLASGGVGASSLVEDVSTLEQEFSNSRMQVFYPTRNRDGDTIMGAIGGKKASMGINGSTMNKRLSTHDRLIDRIDETDQINLVGNNIIPVASESRGARLVDDPTQVDPEVNPEEANMDQGYSRLIVDRATDIVHTIEEPYIGKLNRASTRGSLQAAIDTGIGFLEEQDAIIDYDVRVYKVDAMSAEVEFSVTTVKPLRNIYNKISVGQ